ncbi:MAG: EI24 domain-containing protein [Bacteroidota bacterium]|nr:EI24 domain-containing protein [Bacteroidota bacterium]
MNIAKQIKIGLKGYTKATQLIFTRGYAKYFIFPLIINIILFWVGLGFIADFSEFAREYLIQWMNLKEGAFWGAEYLGTALKGVLNTLLYLLFFILFSYIGGYLIIIILSPVFSVLSEKTEKKVYSDVENYPFNFKQFLKDIVRGIRIAIRNMGIETGIPVLVLIIGLIPVVGWLGTVFMFFVSAYFFGFSYMDYTMERYKLNVKGSVKLMRKYKWTAITNGAIFSVSLFIPYCGIALSAFIAVFSVIAGTISAVEIYKFENGQIKT